MLQRERFIKQVLNIEGFAGTAEGKFASCLMLFNRLTEFNNLETICKNGFYYFLGKIRKIPSICRLLNLSREW